jgi:NADPH2:quinone reductase
MTDALVEYSFARAKQAGGPEVIEVVTESMPVPGPGQALVRVEVAALNHIEPLIRSGKYAIRMPFPYHVGLEGAGTVEAVGPGVALEPGTRVCWTGAPGTCGTHVLANALMLCPIVDGLGFEEAGRLAHAGVTAGALVRVWPVEGRPVVVWGAAGAVGRCLIGRLLERDAQVIGIASGKRGDEVRALGAAHVIDRTEEDVIERVKEYTDGKGAVAVYDPVAAETFSISLKLLAPRGCLINYGQLSGPITPTGPYDLFEARGVFFTKFNGEAYVDGVADMQRLIAEAQELSLRRPKVLAPVADRFPLDGVQTAFRSLETGAPGKVLVLPWS